MQIDILQILADYEREEYSEKQTGTILQNYTEMYGTLFKRYNNFSGEFIKLTRESISNRRNIEKEPDRARTVDDTEREFSEIDFLNALKRFIRTLSYNKNKAVAKTAAFCLEKISQNKI